MIDKIRGLFYGQAIGDALGLGTEFMSKEQVIKHYPDGLSDYQQIIQDNHRKRWRIGDWTDDTDQFLCISDAVIRDKMVVDIHSFATELYKWYSGEPMGIGSTVQKVVSFPQFLDYPHKASELVWKMGGKRNASNGAIMRTAILGLVNYNDLERVRYNTEQIAKVTHWDPRCIGSSVLITLIIANYLMSGEKLSFNDLISLGRKYDERIVPFIELSSHSDISVLELSDSESMGYTLKTMSAALWAYFNTTTFEEGIVQIINEGGDADTNGAVAGALLGVLYGYSSIPQRWIDGLANKSLLEERLRHFAISNSF